MKTGQIGAQIMDFKKVARNVVKPSLDTIYKMKETVDNIREIPKLNQEIKDREKKIDASYEKIGELWRKEYPTPLSERNNQENRIFDRFKR